MFRNQEIINNKGQIVDQEKFNQALMQLMNDKYSGGAQKLSQTTKGMWSTITGITKTSLANIVGMQNDGTIKQGSMLDMLKKKVQTVADTLTRWQSNGTFQKIGTSITNTVTKVMKILSTVFIFIKQHQAMLTNLLIAVSSFYVAVKIGMAMAQVIKVIQTAMLLLNGTLVVSPLGWVVLAMGAVIAAGVLLYKNWDTIKIKALQLWQGIQAAFAPLGHFFAGLWGGVKSGFRSFINFMIRGINKFTSALSWIPKMLSKVPGFSWASNFVIPQLPAFAKGGIATSPSICGEDGAESIIPLKRNNPRSQMLLQQADKIVNGKKSGGVGGVNVVVNIGSYMGENLDQFTDMVGQKIYQGINRTMANMA